MGAYREDRRTEAVPALKAITKNEAMQASDVRRQRTYETAREAIADDLRKQNIEQKGSFAERLANKKK